MTITIFLIILWQWCGMLQHLIKWTEGQKGLKVSSRFDLWAFTVWFKSFATYSTCLNLNIIIDGHPLEERRDLYVVANHLFIQTLLATFTVCYSFKYFSDWNGWRHFLRTWMFYRQKDHQVCPDSWLPQSFTTFHSWKAWVFITQREIGRLSVFQHHESKVLIIPMHSMCTSPCVIVISQQIVFSYRRVALFWICK